MSQSEAFYTAPAAMSRSENPGARLQQTGDAASDDVVEAEFGQPGCCAFGFNCGWERMSGASASADERWPVRSWKKLREWSELVAGPRWKTFIRRFGRNRVAGGGGGGGGQGRFGYDPLSYALNFDDGQSAQNSPEEVGFRDFSSRYAAVPASAKSSMDSGRDGPSFT